MGLTYDFAHEHLGIKDAMGVWYHPPCDSQHGPEQTEIEEYCAVRSDFKVQEDVGIDERSQRQHSRKGTSDKGDKSKNQQLQLGNRQV